MGYLKQISDILDKHRRDVVITCPDDCWCWGVEASICGHPEQASVQQQVEQTGNLEKKIR